MQQQTRLLTSAVIIFSALSGNTAEAQSPRAVVAICAPSKQSTVITPHVVGVRMSYDF